MKLFGWLWLQVRLHRYAVGVAAVLIAAYATLVARYTPHVNSYRVINDLGRTVRVSECRTSACTKSVNPKVRLLPKRSVISDVVVGEGNANTFVVYELTDARAGCFTLAAPHHHALQRVYLSSLGPCPGPA